MLQSKLQQHNHVSHNEYGKSVYFLFRNIYEPIIKRWFTLFPVRTLETDTYL